MKTLAACLFAALMMASPALANSTYRFAYTASGGPSGFEYGSGVITLGPEDYGYSPIIAISGEANGSAITGLSDYAGANNLIFDTSPIVDQGGVSVSTGSGVDYNFYSIDGVYKVLSSSTTPYAWDSNASPIRCLTIQAEPSACPEPATWALIMIGLGGLGLALRRNARSSPREPLALLQGRAAATPPELMA